MTYQMPNKIFKFPKFSSMSESVNHPRMEMLHRIPVFIQPFLTWLTAKAPEGDPVRERSPLFFVYVALLQTIFGVCIASAVTVFAGAVPVIALAIVIMIGLTLTTSGMGLFQVVIFHHCSHGTVFRHRPRNRAVGRLLSAILLFQHFDAYRAGHMLHHSNTKLLTEEDEFADFIFGLCGLRAGLPKALLWRRVILALVSPKFHARFLMRRVRGSWGSGDRAYNRVGMAVWGGMTGLSVLAGHADMFLLAWVLPVTVLLQMATVFRILCEHRFPDPELIRSRGRDFTCHATAGVFPGVMPPRRRATSMSGLLLWALWWANMLSVQVLVRLIVLVGDAPCHDFHHRRPASARWTSYIQARQNDVETNASGYGIAYQESWGLFRAVDQNLASLASTPAEFMP